MKFIIGLTGQTGAGKSSLTYIAQNHGYFVIDCDEVARDIREMPQVIAALKNAFGDIILDSDGRINKTALAEKAFSSKENTRLLNDTILPFIKNAINDIIDSTDSELIMLDAPTLFEANMQDICRYTIGVIAKSDVRLKRIMMRDGIDEKSALSRINAGKNDDFYKSNCDFVIENNGELNNLLNNFELLLKTISGGK